jgi:hypothetical protein
VLFNSSVRDNIALADPAMPIERVIAAAKLAGAHEFILELPKGYDSIVGERGGSLSGGQRQRLAIARALVMRWAARKPAAIWLLGRFEVSLGPIGSPCRDAVFVCCFRDPRGQLSSGRVADRPGRPVHCTLKERT